MTSAPSLIVEVKKAAVGTWGFLTLNQEKSLNALNQEMIDLATPTLEAWEKDSSIVGVVLQGAGEKAFCAGGDIRMLYDAMVGSPGKVLEGAARFFKSEYYLDHLIHRYSKPVLCLGHGIVMGGGLGLMAGASHRVLSERSLVAMPEITIGLYPEVGASWFLNRMPGRTGLYLGLTGTRLKAADALYVKLGDFFIERARHSEVLKAVLETEWNMDTALDRNSLSKLLARFNTDPGVSLLREHFAFVQEITDFPDIQSIWKAFENYFGSDEWILAGRKSLISGSPTSAAVIFEQLKRSKSLSLKECFEMEYTMSNQFARHPDFREGVRALLIDKDFTPKWTPAKIEDVTPEWVAEHFKKA
jgi:enoyl-CoA hydratase/carnithine racemase